MLKHTPGPWRVAPRINYYCSKGTDEEIKILKKINKLEFEALSIGTDNGQIAIIPLDESNRSNALLISYAPEMLDCMIIEVKIYIMSAGIEAAKKTVMCQLIEKATGLKIEEVLK